MENKGEKMDEIRKEVETILDKYWRKEDEYYSMFRYEGEDEKEFDMQEEVNEFLENREGVTDHKVEFEEGFSSTGYDNDFLAICWIYDGEVELVTVLLECM